MVLAQIIVALLLAFVLTFLEFHRWFLDKVFELTGKRVSIVYYYVFFVILGLVMGLL